MPPNPKPTPSLRRIHALAQALQETYLQSLDRGDWFEHLAAMALFVERTLGEIEQAAQEMDDVSELPGELRELFIALLRGGYR